MESRTLRDFEVRDGNHAWLKAVDEVQKVFPGTRNWLRSCSAPTSEGGWGRWVTYRDAYSAEYAAANYIVGGWLQFKLPTFKGFFRHAHDVVRSRGYIIPRELRAASDIQAWQSPLAQALAGGWAATNGQQGHWVGSGC